jgi:hypothetical protein
MEREQETQESESIQQEETSTPATPNPNPYQVPTDRPSTDSEGRQLFLAVLGEKERKIQELEARINSKPPEPPRQITQEEEQSFFSTPKSATRDLIREELSTQLAPLMSFVGSFPKRTALDTIKDQIRQDPRFGAILTENETYIDQMLQGAEPTEANVKSALLTVYGAKQMGLINSPTINNPPVNAPTINGNPPPNQQPANMTIPPHLRPSAPAAPRDESKQPVKPLTENEIRLAREWGMTAEEYRAGQQEGSLIIEPEITAKPKKKD